MIINQDDIRLFMTCPVLFSDFREPKQLSETELLLRKFIDGLYKSNHIDVLKRTEVDLFFKKNTKKLEDNFNTKKINDILLNLNDLYNQLLIDSLEKKRMVIGKDIPVSISANGTVYSVQIPMIFLEGTETVPLFIKTGTYAYDIEYRLGCLAIAECFDVNIKSYYLINDPYKGSSKLIKFKITKEKIDNTKKYFIEIAKRISSEQQFPNTLHCLSCHKKNECNY